MDHVVPPAPTLQPASPVLSKMKWHPYFKKIFLPFLAVLVLAIGLLVGTPLIKRVTRLLTPASANLVDLSFSPSKTTLVRGEQFTVNVLIDAKTYQVSAASVSATFASNTLQVQSITVGPFLDQGYFPASMTRLLTTTIQSGRGTIIVGAACPNVVPTPNPASTPCLVKSGAGILATFNMQVLANAPLGGTQLSFDTSGGNTAVAAISSSTSVLGDSFPLNLTISAPLASGILNFKIKFQGVSTQKPDKSVTVVLRQGTIDTPQTVTVTSDTTGMYSATLSGITPGAYDILVKGPAHLRKKMTSSPISISAATPLQDWTTTPLLAGDINNDNKIDLLDYSLLALKFNPGATQTAVEDLNFDGKVDLLDYSLLALNFNPGVSGD